MKEFVLRNEYDISVREFFTLFFSNSSSFKQEYHRKRGDKDITFTEWKKNDHGTFKRIVTFCTSSSTIPLIKRFIGPTLQIEETQVYHFTSNDDLVVESTTKILNSYLKDVISSYSKWVVSSASIPSEFSSHVLDSTSCNDFVPSPSRCVCIIFVKNECHSSSLPFVLSSIAGTLESFLHESSVSAFSMYTDLLREQIENYRTEKLENNVVPVEPSDHFIINPENGYNREITRESRSISISDSVNNNDSESFSGTEEEEEDIFYDADSVFDTFAQNDDTGNILFENSSFVTKNSYLQQSIKENQHRLNSFETSSNRFSYQEEHQQQQHSNIREDGDHNTDRILTTQSNFSHTNENPSSVGDFQVEYEHGISSSTMNDIQLMSSLVNVERMLRERTEQQLRFFSKI